MTVIIHRWIVKGGLVWIKEITGYLKQFKGVLDIGLVDWIQKIEGFNFIL